MQICLYRIKLIGEFSYFHFFQIYELDFNISDNIFAELNIFANKVRLLYNNLCSSECLCKKLNCFVRIKYNLRFEGKMFVYFWNVCAFEHFNFVALLIDWHCFCFSLFYLLIDMFYIPMLYGFN